MFSSDQKDLNNGVHGEPSESAAEFSVFDNQAGAIGKEYLLNEQGGLSKNVYGDPSRGTYTRLSAPSIDDFMAQLTWFSTKTTCCFVYGVPKKNGDIKYFRTKSRRALDSDVIARCKDDMAFAEGKPGVLYLDFDLAGVDGVPKDWRTLDDIVCEAFAPLRETRRAWKPSNSAFLYRERDGAELKGAGSWRLYVLVDNAAAVPRIIDHIFQRLWEMDYGRIEPAKDGDPLVRSLIDDSTGSPERPDFIAGPILKPGCGIVRKLPEEFPQYRGEKRMLVCSEVPAAEPRASWRKNNPRVLAAKAAARLKCEDAAAKNVEVRLPEFRAANPGTPDEELRDTIRAATTSRVLGLDFVLYWPDRTPLVVRDLLEILLMGCEAVDLLHPTEPDYGGWRPVARAYFNADTNTAYIHSFAHGRQDFDLTAALRELRPLTAGELFPELQALPAPPPLPAQAALAASAPAAAAPAASRFNALDYATDEDEATLPNCFRYATQADGFITGIEFLRPPKKKDEEPKWVFLCSPLRFRAVTTDMNGEGWGLFLLIRDPDNKWKPIVITQAETVEGNGLYKRLLNLGFVCPNHRQMLLTLLAFVPGKIGARARCVPHVGWQERPDGKPVFVLPDRTFGAADSEVVYHPAITVKLAYGVAGTLKGWQDAIAVPAAGNSRLVFALSSAFVGPLLKPLKVEGGGVHYRGPSSTGKTTLLAAAGSVWGGGGAKGFIKTWRATDNAIEGEALAANDALLCLDELALIESEAAAKAAYMLANGAPKSRMTGDIVLRQRHEWLVFFISTGEISIADKVEEKGGRITAGQQVRIVDIAADAGCGFGIFESLHGMMEPSRFADTIRRASSEHFGHAGRAFIERLVSDMEGAKRVLRASMDAFKAAEVPQGADGQVQRVAERFALVAAAGELAASWGILPWSANAARDAAAKLFRSWTEARGSSAESLEMLNAVRRIRQVIEAYGQTRFQMWGSDKAPSGLAVVNQLGFVRIPESEQGFANALPGLADAEAPAEGDGRLFHFSPEQFRREVCKGIGSDIMVKALQAIGALRSDKDRYTKGCKVPKLGWRRFYVVAAEPLFRQL
jgi:putative DNA primase/helicase